MFDYSWDSLGNLTGKTGSEGSWTYTHDTFNRLKTVKDSTANATTTYTYHALNERTKKTGLTFSHRIA